MTHYDLMRLAKAVGGAIHLSLIRQFPTHQFDWPSVTAELIDDVHDSLDCDSFGPEEFEQFTDAMGDAIDPAGGYAKRIQDIRDEGAELYDEFSPSVILDQEPHLGDLEVPPSDIGRLE